MVVFARDAAWNRASLKLTCMASGSPAPITTWFRNGALLSLNQRIQMNASGHIANILPLHCHQQIWDRPQQNSHTLLCM